MLAWVYVEHGDTPAFEHVLYGVVPVVVAIIVWALVPLIRTVVRSWWLAVLLAAGLAAYLLGVNELVVLFGGAAVAALVHLGRSLATSARHGLVLATLPVFPDPTAGQLATLFATMLKIGAVLYGSGYVLLAFLEGDFVDRLGWITHEQLLDAVSIGQVTPGPVFTTATFVGYLVAGLAGRVRGHGRRSSCRRSSSSGCSPGWPAGCGRGRGPRRCSTGSTPPRWR